MKEIKLIPVLSALIAGCVFGIWMGNPWAGMSMYLFLMTIYAINSVDN